MFGCSLMEMWTMDICEGRSWSLYVPQSPVSWIVTGTCTHLMERGYLLLHFHDYLLSCVFAAIWQILRGGSHRLQSNQLKTRKIFLPQRGIEPRTFQSWVFCLAIWAITPHHKYSIIWKSTKCYTCEILKHSKILCVCLEKSQRALLDKIWIAWLLI